MACVPVLDQQAGIPVAMLREQAGQRGRPAERSVHCQDSAGNNSWSERQSRYLQINAETFKKRALLVVFAHAKVAAIMLGVSKWLSGHCYMVAQVCFGVLMHNCYGGYLIDPDS